MLSSARTADLLRNLGEQADIVLIDSPPTLPVTDALVLSQRVDSTLLVTAGGQTTRKAVARAVEMLRQVNAPLVGAVLNRVAGEHGYAEYANRYYATTDGGGSPTPEGSNAADNGSRRTRKRTKRTAA